MGRYGLMSETSRAVSDATFEYLAARTAGDDDYLKDLKARAREASIPAIWISPEQASFMSILLRVAGAREVIEVGTLGGYSAIAMARALPADGRVRTIELSDMHADFAEDAVENSDVAGRVEVHRGAGADVLPMFADDSADAAFIDADKEGYVTYVTECLRIVRPGGLIMVDNAFAFGELLDSSSTDASVLAVRAFNEHMAALEEVDAIIVPIGDGVWVGVRR
jgi:caffeoyl-CoA O-methyltransferase